MDGASKLEFNKKKKTDIEMKLTIGELEKDLLKRIERLEAFEERLGVSIQNLSVRIDSERKWLTIFYELYSAIGTTIKEYITVECILYDEDGLIIEEAHSIIETDKFFGFEVIKEEFREYGIAERVSKIRVYPKKF